MSTIRIPVDIHIIVLQMEVTRVVERQIRVGRETQTRRERVTEMQRLPNRHTDQTIAQAFELANQILAPADIVFVRRTTSNELVNAPQNREVVNTQGFFYLTQQFPASGGVTALFVDRFESPDLGGEAVERDSSLITAYHGHPATGKVLAHEFGHLLNLQHVDRGSTRANWNLMYEALRAGDELSASQISRARTARLAQMFVATAAAR